MSLTVELVRVKHTDKSTLGMLFIGGSFIAYTLENPWLDNKRRVSCIPIGTYEVGFRTTGGKHNQYAARYGKKHYGMLEVKDVPNRTFILFHVGNWAKDTHGCILLGTRAGVNMIGSSRKAYAQVYPIIAKALRADRKVTLKIREI